MSLAGTVKRMVEKYGSSWTLCKQSTAAGSNDWTAGSVTKTYTAFKAQGREATPDMIARGGLLEHDWMVTADPATFSAVPAQGDLIASGSFTDFSDVGADWLQIVNVITPSEGASDRVYKLHARR